MAAGWLLGVDIGSTTLKAVLVDTASGTLRESRTRMVLDYGMKIPGQDQQIDYRLDQRTTSRLLPDEGTKAE